MHFLNNFEREIVFFGARFSLKIVNIGAKGAFRKIFKVILPKNGGLKIVAKEDPLDSEGVESKSATGFSAHK